nr:hypothetical protein [Tanacetum cinerariifolium]
MFAKNALGIQRCELSRKELYEFLSSYSIPSEYLVILPTPTQTILDAPPGYIGLYIHCFSLDNLRLPLNDFFCELLLKENMFDVKYFKDKLPSGIEKNLQFQYIARYPVSARAFDDLILFLAGLQSSWEHGQHRPAIFMGGKEMAFRNFIYIEDDEDLTFLSKDFSPGFNIGSPCVSINTELVRDDEEPTVEPTIKPAIEPVNERRKCKTRGGSLRPPIKRKLAYGSSTSCTVRAKASAIKDDTPMLSISNDDEGLEDFLELKDATACHLKISTITPPTWKGFLDNHLDVDLLDLHDRFYARQAVVHNVVNRRSRELLDAIKKLRGEADVMRARELAHEEEFEGLRAKCEAAITDFDMNPAVLLLREKVSSLAAEAKEHKGNLDKLMLETKKANLEATEASLRHEIEEVKHDRREVVSKAVPYACMELLHSDELGRLVGKLVSSAITFGRCRAYEQVSRMKAPFDLSKVMRYRLSYENEHTQAINDLATATFSWLNEYIADASASVEALLLQKPLTL